MQLFHIRGWRIADAQIRYKYTNTVGGTENKEAILDENDPVWMSVKHLHMKDAIDTLMMDFNKFAQEHAGFNAGYVPTDPLSTF